MSGLDLFINLSLLAALAVGAFAGWKARGLHDRFRNRRT